MSLQLCQYMSNFFIPCTPAIFRQLCRTVSFKSLRCTKFADRRVPLQATYFDRPYILQEWKLGAPFPSAYHGYKSAEASALTGEDNNSNTARTLPAPDKLDSSPLARLRRRRAFSQPTTGASNQSEIRHLKI